MIRRIFFWVATLIMFAAVNWMIVSKERLLASGETMLLRLAPRDPRSLMMGDYMSLRYAIVNDSLVERLRREGEMKGKLVVRLDSARIASYVRVYHGEPLARDEHLLVYRLRGLMLRLGAEAFYFQEGSAHLYDSTHYGVLKVAPDGESILVGLRN